jgi:hypothetical protein
VNREDVEQSSALQAAASEAVTRTRADLEAAFTALSSEVKTESGPLRRGPSWKPELPETIRSREDPQTDSRAEGTAQKRLMLFLSQVSSHHKDLPQEGCSFSWISTLPVYMGTWKKPYTGSNQRVLMMDQAECVYFKSTSMARSSREENGSFREISNP